MTSAELAQDMAQAYPKKEPYDREDLRFVAVCTALRKDRQIDSGCRKIAAAIQKGEFENLCYTNIVEKLVRIIKESEL